MDPTRREQRVVATEATPPKTYKEALAENERLKGEIEKLKNRLLWVSDMLPATIENGAAKGVCDGYSTYEGGYDLQAKQIPGTVLHYRYLQGRLAQLNGKLNLLGKECVPIDADYSLYSGAKRESIIKQYLEMSEIYNEIHHLMVAECTRITFEAQKEKALVAWSSRCFETDVLVAEWPRVLDKHTTVSATINYLERLVFPICSYRAMATELKEISEKLRQCQLNKDASGEVEKLRAQSTIVSEKFNVMEGPHLRFWQVAGSPEIRKSIHNDKTYCEEMIGYTSDQLNVIDHDRQLTHVIEKLDWAPSTQAKESTEVKGEFKARVDLYVTLKTAFDALKAQIKALQPTYETRMHFLRQNPSQGKPGALLLVEHQKQLLALWEKTVGQLIEFQFQIQFLGYKIGSEIEIHNPLIKLEFESEQRLLLLLNSAKGLPEGKAFETHLATQKEWLAIDGSLHTLLGQLKDLGVTLPIFSPHISLEEGVLIASQEKKPIEGERLVALANLHKKFKEHILAFLQASYHLQAFRLIFFNYMKYEQRGAEIEKTQLSLIDRANLFLTNAQDLAKADPILAFKKEIDEAKSPLDTFKEEHEAMTWLADNLKKGGKTVAAEDMLTDSLTDSPHLAPFFKTAKEKCTARFKELWDRGTRLDQLGSKIVSLSTKQTKPGPN